MSATGFGTQPGLAAFGGATGAGLYTLGGATSGEGAKFEAQKSDNGLEVIGNDVGHGLYAVGGATGSGAVVESVGNNPAMYITDQAGGGDGLMIDSATGIAMNLNAVANTGLKIAGGVTSPCVDIAAPIGGTAADGVKIQGKGSGSGINIIPGITGHGIWTKGGATSGDAIRAHAVGAGNGINALAVGTNHGILAKAGTTGKGIYAQGGTVAGEGMLAEALAGNSSGLKGIKFGTGHGIEGDTDIYPVAAWADLEGAEPIAAIADNASFGVILQHLKRHALNAADQTVGAPGTRTTYRDDSATTLDTQTVQVTGTTQTRGKVT